MRRIEGLIEIDASLCKKKKYKIASHAFGSRYTNIDIYERVATL